MLKVKSFIVIHDFFITIFFQQNMLNKALLISRRITQVVDLGIIYYHVYLDSLIDIQLSLALVRYHLTQPNKSENSPSPNLLKVSSSMLYLQINSTILFYTSFIILSPRLNRNIWIIVNENCKWNNDIKISMVEDWMIESVVNYATILHTQSCHQYSLFKTSIKYRKILNINPELTDIFEAHFGDFTLLIEIVWVQDLIISIFYYQFIPGTKYEEIPVNEVKDRVIGRIKLDMAEWFFKHIGKHFNALNTVVQQASMYMQHLCIPYKQVCTLSPDVQSMYLICHYPARPNAA